VSIQNNRDFDNPKPTHHHSAVFRNIHNYSRYKMNSGFTGKEEPIKERIFFRGKVLKQREVPWKIGEYRS
jgi:hypothetical protein